MNNGTNGLLSSLWNPRFLKSFDRHALLNHPRLWNTQLYYVIYRGFLLNTVWGILVFIYPIRVYQFAAWYNLVILFVLGSVILAELVVWGTRLEDYNVEKELGHTRPYVAIGEVYAYVVCLAIILSPLFSSVSLVQMKLSFQVSESELTEDITLLEESDDDSEFDYLILEKYTGQVGASCVEALSRARTMQIFVYASSIRHLVVVVYIFILNFGGLLLFAGKHNHEPLSSALGTSVGIVFYYLLFLWLLWLLFKFFFQSFLSIGFSPDQMLFFVAIVIWLSTLFIIFHVIAFKRLDKFSTFKSTVLTLFPLTIVVSVYVFLILLNGDVLVSIPYAIVANLSYVPFLPYVKKQFMYLLALPRR
jgi:hypothetical protein